MWLKQSTQVVVSFGPFLDKTDGVTLETGLVSAIDHATTGAMCSKNGGALTIRSQAVTASTYDARGCYRVTLSTTDTNTLGTLRLIFEEAATALPVWQDFMVVPANVWDSMFGADALQVDVAQWLGTAAATPTVAGVPEVDLTHVAGATTNVAALATNVDAILTDTADMQPKLGTPAGASVSADVAAVKVDTAAILVDTGTTLDGRIPAALVGGRMDGSVGAIAAGVDLTATMKASVNTEVDSALDTAIPGVPTGDSINQRVRSMDLLTEAAGAGDLAAVLTDTADMQPKLGTPAGASVSADVAAVKVDTAAILVDTGTTLDGRIPAALVGGRVDASVGAIAAGVDLTATMKTSVNAEVVDALATDTYAEPGQGAPAATATLAAKINYLFKAWRNRITQTATTYRLYGDDAATVDQKATISDDATTFDKGEVASGP